MAEQYDLPQRRVARAITAASHNLRSIPKTLTAINEILHSFTLLKFQKSVSTHSNAMTIPSPACCLSTKLLFHFLQEQVLLYFTNRPFRGALFSNFIIPQ